MVASCITDLLSFPVPFKDPLKEPYLGTWNFKGFVLVPVIVEGVGCFFASSASKPLKGFCSCVSPLQQFKKVIECLLSCMLYYGHFNKPSYANLAFAHRSVPADGVFNCCCC